MAEVKHVFIKLGFGKPSSAVGMTAQRLDQAAGLDGLKSSVVYNICVRAVETLQMASLARRAAKQQELTGGCAVDAGSSQAITHGDGRAARPANNSSQEHLLSVDLKREQAGADDDVPVGKRPRRRGSAADRSLACSDLLKMIEIRGGPTGSVDGVMRNAGLYLERVRKFPTILNSIMRTQLHKATVDRLEDEITSLIKARDNLRNGIVEPGVAALVSEYNAIIPAARVSVSILKAHQQYKDRVRDGNLSHQVVSQLEVEMTSHEDQLVRSQWHTKFEPSFAMWLKEERERFRHCHVVSLQMPDKLRELYGKVALMRVSPTASQDGPYSHSDLQARFFHRKVAESYSSLMKMSTLGHCV